MWSAEEIVSVHNDFHSTHGIFKLFDGLQVAGMDETVETTQLTNGNGEVTAQLNGTHQPNDPSVFNEVNT